MEHHRDEQAYHDVATSVGRTVKSMSLFCLSKRLIRALRWQLLMFANLPLSV